MWQFYRLDFQSSSGQDTQTPTNSWYWDVSKSGWARRSKANDPIDVSDAVGDSIFVQIDTASTDVGSNLTTSADINFAAASVPLASTATFGGRFDNASSGFFHEEKALPDGLIKSFSLTNAPPYFRINYDNNTSKAGYCTVFVSFKAY